MSQERFEIAPLAVEEDAAQVKHPLGETTAPTHSGTIESHPDEIADGALGSAGADVQVALTELAVGHSVAVFHQIANELEQAFALALVARPCLGNLRQLLPSGGKHGATSTAAQALGLLCYPGGQLGRALRASSAAGPRGATLAELR